MKKIQVYTLVKELLTYVPNAQKIKLIYIFLLTIVSSVLEVISLGAVVPFIAALSNADLFFQDEIYLPYLNFFNISSTDTLIIFLTFVFGISALLAGILRIYLLRFTLITSANIGSYLSTRAFKNILKKPYIFHLQNSSSELINGIVRKVKISSAVIASVVTVATSLIIFISIFTTLLFINSHVAVIAGIIFSIVYFIISRISKKILYTNSAIISSESNKEVKSLQEGIGAIRDVILDGAEDLHSSYYSKSVKRLQLKNASNAFINQYPRFLMESVGLLLVTGLLYFSHSKLGDVSQYFPILAALALGAQRTLPLLQSIYGNWTHAIGNYEVIKDVNEILYIDSKDNLNNLDDDVVVFKDAIKFKDIEVRYPNSRIPAISKINLKINSGDRIAIIGETGSGKSTFLDLLMGFLPIDDGILTIDSKQITNDNYKSLRALVSHVPQHIFLADITFTENIAFNTPPHLIDFERVKYAAKKAQIYDFIISTENAFDTIVGERGSRLSGGQMQRIGIARALYKKFKILVLDEATSALDINTEKKIIQNISELDIKPTIVMVTHRHYFLGDFDKVVEFSGGTIKSVR